jgi:hypothetical protein
LNGRHTLFDDTATQSAVGRLIHEQEETKEQSVKDNEVTNITIEVVSEHCPTIALALQSAGEAFSGSESLSESDVHAIQVPSPDIKLEKMSEESDSGIDDTSSCPSATTAVSSSPESSLWSQSTTTEQSILPVILEPWRKAMLDRLLTEMHSLLGKQAQFRSCNNGQETSLNDSQSVSKSNSQSLNAGTIRKRSRMESRQPDSPNESDDDPGSKKPKTVSDIPFKEMGRRLACPYYQRNPHRHIKFRSCSGPGWESVHRLK